MGSGQKYWIDKEEAYEADEKSSFIHNGGADDCAAFADERAGGNNGGRH